MAIGRIGSRPLVADDTKDCNIIHFLIVQVALFIVLKLCDGCQSCATFGIFGLPVHDALPQALVDTHTMYSNRTNML